MSQGHCTSHNSASRVAFSSTQRPQSILQFLQELLEVIFQVDKVKVDFLFAESGDDFVEYENNVVFLRDPLRIEPMYEVQGFVWIESGSGRGVGEPFISGPGQLRKNHQGEQYHPQDIGSQARFDEEQRHQQEAYSFGPCGLNCQAILHRCRQAVHT